jgi:hypothetical protein
MLSCRKSGSDAWGRRCAVLRRVAGFLPLSLCLACSSSSVEIGNPLTIELTVDRSTGVAGTDSFTFRYEATGKDLMGVVLAFGDGQADSLAARGATSAGATRTHVYDIPGSYAAFARAIESFGETLADTVLVEVQSP